MCLCKEVFKENSSFSFKLCFNCEVAMKVRHALHIYKLMISAVLIRNVGLMSLKNHSGSSKLF